MQLDLSTLHDTMNCCQQELKKTFSSVFTVFIFCPHFSGPVSLILVEMGCMYWIDKVLNGWLMLPTEQRKLQFLALMWSGKKINPKCKPLPDCVNQLILSDIPISCILLKIGPLNPKRKNCLHITTIVTEQKNKLILKTILSTSCLLHATALWWSHTTECKHRLHSVGPQRFLGFIPTFASCEPDSN